MSRHRGGQIGNHNRLKHGFYSKSRPQPLAEDALLPEDYGDEIDRDIAITRKTIRSLLANDPNNHRLVSYNVSLLQRLMLTRRKLPEPNQDAARRAAERLGRELTFTSSDREGAFE